MEEREIDLVSLIFHILLHWRSLIVAGLIGMLLFGSYNAVKVVSDAAAIHDGGAVTISDEDMNAICVYENSIRMYESMQAAWLNSAYMALDGNNVAKTGVLVTIRGKSAARMINIAKAYRDMAVSTGAIDYICRTEGIKDTGLVELINITTDVVNSTDSTNAVANSYIGEVVFSDEESECVIPFYIVVMGRDADASERMADLLIEYLDNEKNNVAANMGEHSLIVLSRSTSIGMDSTVINRQSANYSSLSRLYDTMVAQKKALSAEQREYYERVLSDNVTDDNSTGGVIASNQVSYSESAKTTLGWRSFISAKYLAVGLFIGVFCIIGLWSALYILSNRIKSEDPIEKLFGVAVVGLIPAEYEKKRIFGFVDKWIISIRDRNKRIFSVDEAVSLIVSRVKVQSSKEAVSKLVFIGCDLSRNVIDIPESMAEKLSSGDMNVTVLDNVLYDPENTERLGEMDGALIIEKAGKTLYSELTEEIELLKRQQVKLLGCVIVE